MIKDKKEKASVGKPLRYKPKEVEKMIDEYFKSTPEEEWTVTGLAMALDVTRQMLFEYQCKEEYGDPIKKAKIKVENSYEKDLKKSGRTGTIFALKNFGWKDKTESDITSNGESINPVLVKFLDEPTNNNNS